MLLLLPNLFADMTSPIAYLLYYHPSVMRMGFAWKTKLATFRGLSFELDPRFLETRLLQREKGLDRSYQDERNAHGPV